MVNYILELLLLGYLVLVIFIVLAIIIDERLESYNEKKKEGKKIEHDI